MSERKRDNQEKNLKKTKREDSHKGLNGGIFTRIKFGSWRDINETSGKQRCRGVIIENCPTLQEVVVALKDSFFIDLLAKWEVFIVILSLSGPLSINEVTLSQISKKIKNVWILQLNYEGGKMVFFKESNEEFKKFELLEDEFEESFIENGLDFGFMCNLLHFGTNIGVFNFNLPETEIAMEKSICGYRLIDWAVRHNSILCLNILRMFDPDFESLNESSTRLLEVAAEFGTTNSFKILFDTGIMGPSQKRILNLISKNDENLLMIAVRSENIEIVTFLIDCGLNANLLNTSGQTVSDVAWQKYAESSIKMSSDIKSNCKKLDVLIKLLYNDAPFPRSFDKSQIESKLHALRFKALICDRQNFHDAIRDGQLAQVKYFLKDNNLKYAYDIRNQCALTTAILSKSFEIYSFLRSKGFSGGIDYKLETHLQKLQENDKVKLRKCNLKYFKANESQHIMDLVSKSRLAFESDQKHFVKIQKLFESLDAIEEFRPILKIVASSGRTDIVFDFNSDSIEEMDPTGADEIHVKATTYHKTGHILIGAKRKTDNMLLGTLAHELTHYAMQFVYGNNCLPFKLDDELREKEFEEIANTYDNQSCKPKQETIASALNSSYSLEQVMAELIVRVPQLLALHFNEPGILAEIREEFSLLFNFFEQQTLADLKRESSLVNDKRKIKEANNYFGVFAKAAQSNWLLDASTLSIDLDEKVFIASSLPNLVLESCIKLLQHENSEYISSSNIFVNLEQMFIEENFEMLSSAAESEALQLFFIIEDTENSGIEVVEDKWRSLFNSCEIIFISKNRNSAYREYFQRKKYFDLDWSNLSDESKSRILRSKVTFQDQEVTLSEIVDNKMLLKPVPLKLLLEPSKLKLTGFLESLPEPPRVFIERTFINSAQKDKLNTEDICDILKKQKKMLIADSAGMGKSTSAAQIARKLKSRNPLSWVVFIDLKQHTKAFVRDGQPWTVTVDTKYFNQKILKLGDKFEQKLFESFFENRKVIFVIDGFDEISPIYKQFVMEILKAIQNSDNQFLVTTRPHLSGELQKELDATVFKLMPFTYEDQIEFLTKWLHTKNIEEAKVGSLWNKFKLDWDFDFYSTPIHIFMLAEVFEDLINLENIKMDVFSLYKRFITIKLKVWGGKGPLAEEDSAEIQQSTLNLQQIFHKLALKQLFDADELKDLNLSEIPEEIMNEMVLRVGIVSFGPDGTMRFTHRTFAEYFAADFILKGVIGKNIQSANLDLFFRSLDERTTVTKLMDEGLRYFEDKLNAEAFSRHFDKNDPRFLIDVDRGYRGIFHSILIENRANLVALVLEKLIIDTNVKIKVMKNIFKRARDIETFKVICRCVKNFEKDVQKDILFYRDDPKYGAKTVLDQVIVIDRMNDEKITLRLILEIAVNVLNEEEFLKFVIGEEGNRFQFYDDVLGCQGVLPVIWQAAKRKLGAENLQRLATGKSKEGNTILLSFDGNPYESNFQRIFDELQWWLKDIKNLLTTNELSELIAAKHKHNDGLITDVVHFIKLEDFRELWKFIQENIDEAGQRKIIFYENSRKENLLKLSVKNRYKRVSGLVYEITKSLLLKDGKDIIEYLKEQGRLADFIFVTVIRSPSLFKKISSKIQKDELRTILLGKTSNGDNILHRLLQYNTVKLKYWTSIINIINDVQAVKKLLFEMDSSHEKNVFDLAESCGFILIIILRWCKKNYCKEDFKNIFLDIDFRSGFNLKDQWLDSGKFCYVEIS